MLGNDKSSEIRLDRRQLLSAGGLVAVSASLAGCGFFDRNTADDKRSGTKGKEAPSLADLVKAGKLPPVEQRLPAQPVVVQPVERMGVYGGTWRSATTGVADGAWLFNTIWYDRPLHFDFATGKLQPNIFEAFESNADSTEFTLKIRRGIKWSDGTPYTADDIVFWMEDVLGNKELTPAVPGLMKAAGKPATVTKVDDLTVKVTFAAPNGLWLRRLDGAFGTGNTMHERPKHYLQQFHPKYASNLDGLVKQAGVAHWGELFNQKADRAANPELPSLHPWVLKTPLADGRVLAERNPYYWKVDPDGSQLPYIDQVIFELVADAEVMLTRGSGGEFDLHMRHFNTQRNKPVLADNREKGNYRFFDISPESMCTGIIALNLTHKDPMKRAIFANKDFRIGLSHALNREEIIKAIYASQGEPYQAAPRPESEFYDEEFAKQYTEYDISRAKEHLDRVLPKLDGDGLRLGPDGKRFSFTIEIATGFNAEWIDVAELAKGYFRAVGVDIQVKTEDRTLFTERVIGNATRPGSGNQHDAVIWSGAGGGVDIMLRPHFFVPAVGVGEVFYGKEWTDWVVTAGAQGTQPPARVKQQLDLYAEVGKTADQDKQKSLMKEVLNIAKEEFYAIGISLLPKEYGIAKNNFRNVPATVSASVIKPPPGNTQPCQFFIESGA